MTDKEDFKTIDEVDEVPESWLDNCSDNVDKNEKVGDTSFYYGINDDAFCIRYLGKDEKACCEHGVFEGRVIFDDGKFIRGYFTIENLNNVSV